MATKNKLQDLRNHLFEVLEALKDEEKPMDIERALAVSDVAKVIIDTAKVEITAAKAFGWDDSQASGFIQQPPKTLEIGK